MSEQHSYDVAVIGGGIMGASTALFLRQRGLRVTLVERDLCGSRSSGVNFGGVRRQGRNAAQLPLSMRSHALWGQLPALIGTTAEYVRSGHFKLARSEADFASLARYAQMAAEHGLDLQLVEGNAAVRKLFPQAGSNVVGGSICAEDGQANPRLVSPAFAQAAQRAGAQVWEQAPVQEAGHDGQRFSLQVRQHDRTVTLKADVLVNTAGAWSGVFAAQFGEAVPMYSSPPAMAVTEPLPFFLPWSLGVEGGGLYCRQVARGNVVFGGGKGYAQDDIRARSAHTAMLYQLRELTRLLPTLQHAHIIRTWSGTEGYLPDGQPVIGPSSTQPGLFHAFGFAGGGFQLGPGVGDVLAELIAEGRTSTPIDAFSIQRFQQP